MKMILFTHFKVHIISYKVNNSLKDDILYDRSHLALILLLNYFGEINT